MRTTSVWLLCVAALACAETGPSDQGTGTPSNSSAPADPPSRAEPSPEPPPTPTFTVRRVPELSAFDVLELPLGWAVPTDTDAVSITADFTGSRLAVQQAGIYVDTTWVAELAAAADPSVRLDDIQALSTPLAAKFDPENPFETMQLFIDPRLPTGTVLRVLAVAKRAGWVAHDLVVTAAPTTRYATGQLTAMPPPPPLTTPGWFEVVVDVGDAEIRIGKVVSTGAVPKSGEMRGLEEVEWLAPEPRGTDEFDRLTRRLALMAKELRGIDPEEPRAVHVSVGPERPFGELMAVRSVAEAPICPPGDRKPWDRSGCDSVYVVVRAGPPPLPAIDEIVPSSWLPH